MLKMNHVVKRYDSFTLECSLEVQAGCIIGLIGQNGAGKSTTFKSILGLIHIDNGEILIDGKNVKELSEKEKQKIGVVLSDSGFSMSLNIQDIAAILEKLYEQFDKKEFLEQCKHFELPMDKKIKDFSTGMKAKLKVLVAISHKASLLILDEPTVGLDVMARDEILEMLRSYMEEDENRAILISSHISTDLEGLCDAIYMIHDGKIILHEETDVLLSDYALLKVSEKQYETLEKQYILKTKKESFGYCCLTNQKQFYLENYKDIIIEKGNIDELIVMMAGGTSI